MPKKDLWQLDLDPGFADDDLEVFGSADDQDSMTLRKDPRRIFKEMMLLVGVVVFVAIIWNLRQAIIDHELMRNVQGLLDQEMNAVLEHDGDYFLSLISDDPAWISAQLQPEIYTSIRKGMSVSKVTQSENQIWAQLEVADGTNQYYRIGFFENRRDGLIHVSPDSAAFWGPLWRKNFSWGTLIYYSEDHAVVDEIGLFVEKKVSEICLETCLIDRVPFVLVVGNDYGKTAAPGQIRIPSPKLLGADVNGFPDNYFWVRLVAQLDDYLKPTKIRFGVFSPGTLSADHIMDYENAVDKFREIKPHINIELVYFDETSRGNYEVWSDLDGVAIPPSLDLIVSGQVLDLTDYVRTDPEIEQVDFYEPIWNGTLWKDRVWFLPQAASMPVMYFDKGIIKDLQIPSPHSGWQWVDFEQNVSLAGKFQSANPTISNWGFLGLTLDMVYSYAYGLNTKCADYISSAVCTEILRKQDVAGALEWFSNMAGEPGQIPDVSGLTDDEREFLLLNWQGANRKAALWIDTPINFEHQYLLNPMGVVSFPGDAPDTGIAPLEIHGSFILQNSRNPRAAWEWVKYLSFQKPISRKIPARKSVADQFGFWQNLPGDLGQVMRYAFPMSRAIRIDEREMIRWEQLAMVESGEMLPIEAAWLPPPLKWFNHR